MASLCLSCLVNTNHSITIPTQPRALHNPCLEETKFYRIGFFRMFWITTLTCFHVKFFYTPSLSLLLNISVHVKNVSWRIKKNIYTFRCSRFNSKFQLIVKRIGKIYGLSVRCVRSEYGRWSGARQDGGAASSER